MRLEPRLHAGLLQVLVHGHEHLTEPLLRPILYEGRLELVPRGGGHAGDEVGELQRVVKVVVFDDLLELLLVLRGRLQQLLHRRDILVMERAPAAQRVGLVVVAGEAEVTP